MFYELHLSCQMSMAHSRLFYLIKPVKWSACFCLFGWYSKFFFHKKATYTISRLLHHVTNCNDCLCLLVVLVSALQFHLKDPCVKSWWEISLQCLYMHTWLSFWYSTALIGKWKCMKDPCCKLVLIHWIFHSPPPQGS